MPVPFLGVRLTVQQLVVNKANLQRHVGLETFFGGGPQGRGLADVMGLGAGSAIDEPEDQRHEAIICNECSADVLMLFHKIRQRREAELEEFEEDLEVAAAEVDADA